MAIFGVAAMTIMCSVINGAEGWKLYPYKQLEGTQKNT
jgi:hypothetical protein